MSKERLEEIKIKVENTEDAMLYVPYTDMRWLIVQAERVQELEDILEQDARQAVIESMYLENEQLKEQLKKSPNLLDTIHDIAELESAHRMMLARNERIEKENAKLTQLNANLWSKNENYVAVLRWIVNVGTDPRSVSKAKEILRRYGREEKQDECS